MSTDNKPEKNLKQLLNVCIKFFICQNESNFA